MIQSPSLHRFTNLVSVVITHQTPVFLQVFNKIFASMNWSILNAVETQVLNVNWLIINPLPCVNSFVKTWNRFLFGPIRISAVPLL